MKKNRSPSSCRVHRWNHTAKRLYRKFETNVPRKGIARPQSQFPHSCVCERFIYSHNRPAYSAARKYLDRYWKYINRSQTHECGNWDWGRRNSFSGNTNMGFSLQCKTFFIYFRSHVPIANSDLSPLHFSRATTWAAAWAARLRPCNSFSGNT